MVEPLLDNPRLLTAKVAAVLGGTAIERPPQLTGFLNSEFDPFLNQLFAAGSVTPREATEALEGRPGFIWLADEPDPNEVGAAEAENLSLVLMHGMTATTARPATAPQVECEIAEVARDRQPPERQRRLVNVPLRPRRAPDRRARALPTPPRHERRLECARQRAPIAWQRDHLLLTSCARERPWEIESEVIAQLGPPLNTAANAVHAFYPTVRAARAEFRRRARAASSLSAQARPVR